MNTLTTAPLPSLIERLFVESDAAMPAIQEEMRYFSKEELTELMSSKSDYRGFYMRAKEFPLAVSRETGTLLYMLARAIHARSIVEFGTSLGVSTLHLAAALRDNGGGRLIGSEFEPSKVERARANIAEAGLSDLVEIRAGDALETLAKDLPESIDLLLLDGAKGLYPAVLALVEKRLRSGALIVADDTQWCPGYQARVRSLAHGYMSVPFGDDVELSMRIG